MPIFNFVIRFLNQDSKSKLRYLLLLPLLITAFGCNLTLAENETSAANELEQKLSQSAKALILDRAQDYNGTPEITLGQIDTQKYDDCDSLDLRIAGNGDLRPVTTVVAQCLAPKKWRVYIKANVKIMGDYYVASRMIQRNESISLGDIELRETDLIRNRKAISSPEFIIGWLANRRLSAGSTITANSLRDPNSISRGQQVQTVARGIGFAINGTGTAMGTGSPGMQIQVRSPNGTVITGTVIDANTVQVLM